jgi:hypothetical protein
MDTIIFTIHSIDLQDKTFVLIEQQLFMYYDFSHLCFLMFLYI